MRKVTSLTARFRKRSQMKPVTLIVFLIFCLICGLFFAWSGRQAFTVSTHTYENDTPLSLTDNTFTQDLTTDGNTLCSIQVQFDIDDGADTDGTIHLSLSDDSGTIQNWDVNASELTDDQYYSFSLTSPVDTQDGEKLTLQLSQTGTNGISVYTDHKDSDDDTSGWGTLYENNQTVSDSTMCCQQTLFFAQTYHKVLTEAAVLAIAVMIMILAGFNELIIMAAVLSGVGLLWSQAMPNGEVPDELGHWMRTVEISAGGFLSQKNVVKGEAGSYLPAAVRQPDDLNSVLTWGKTVPMANGNMALYSPVSYLPQVITLKIAELFTNRVYYLFRISRLGTMIACIAVSVLALKEMPFGRKIMFLLMLSPMTMQEMMSLAPDGMTTALCFFLFAEALHLAFQEEAVTQRQLIWFSIGMILLSQYKIVYIVLILLVYLIPKKNFSSKKQRIYVRLILPAAALVCNLIWLAVSSGYLGEAQPGVDSGAQISFVLHHVPYFIQVCFTTLYNNFAEWMYEMAGNLLGPRTIGLPMAILLMNLFVFIAQMFMVRDVPETSRKTSLLLLLIFLLISGLICASLYAHWTAVGANVIQGIQGRYFTPVLPALVLPILFAVRRQDNFHGNTALYTQRTPFLFMYVLLTDGIALLMIYNYYLRVSL